MLWREQRGSSYGKWPWCVQPVCVLQRRHSRRKLALRKIRKIRSLCEGEASGGCSSQLGEGGIDPAEWIAKEGDIDRQTGGCLVWFRNWRASTEARVSGQSGPRWWWSASQGPHFAKGPGEYRVQTWSTLGNDWRALHILTHLAITSGWSHTF